MLDTRGPTRVLEPSGKAWILRAFLAPAMIAAFSVSSRSDEGDQGDQVGNLFAEWGGEITVGERWPRSCEETAEAAPII